MPKTDQSFDPREYSTVAERIQLFYGSHPAGRITTELVTRDADSVTFKAMVFRDAGDPVPAATGWATEREGDGDINTVACLENTETSAIGRALANLGYTASRHRPSVEEMRKAARVRERRARRLPQPAGSEEHDPAYGAEYAHLLADLLTLLADAERAGLRGARAAKLRSKLERGDRYTPERLAEIERALRQWLKRRESTGAPPVSMSLSPPSVYPHE